MAQEKIVAVVGSSGFVGRYVVRELAKAGWRVRVICRHPADAQYVKTAGDLGQVSVVYGNILKMDTVAPHLAGCDAVVNLVGILFERGRQRFGKVHHEAAEKLAQAAKLAGVKSFVHISALGVDQSSRKSKYAASKLRGEQAVKAAFPDSVVLRPSVIFGPEDDFTNRFARMALVLPALPLIGGGKTKFQPVHVTDVARAVVAVVGNPLTRGHVYELGGAEVMTFKSVLEFILEVTQRKAWLASVPFALARIKSFFLKFLPTPPLTPDQVRLLEFDNVVKDTEHDFRSLGIEPVSLRTAAPEYLSAYRRGGRAYA